MEIGTIISIGAVVISMLTLVLNRIDKARQNTKEDNKELIEYRLKQVEEKLDRILEKLDRYDEEVDERIEKALKLHIEVYHTHKRKE